MVAALRRISTQISTVAAVQCNPDNDFRNSRDFILIPYQLGAAEA